MDKPDLNHFRVLLIEASEELRTSSELAEQVDLHAAAAKRKIAEARVEFDKIADDLAGMSKPVTGKGQQR